MSTVTIIGARRAVMYGVEVMQSDGTWKPTCSEFPTAYAACQDLFDIAVYSAGRGEYLALRVVKLTD